MPEVRPSPDSAPAPGAADSKKVQVSCSPGFLEWLAAEGIGVAFTTYQTNRLFLVGRDEEGRLAAFERLLDRPMGLAVTSERLWVATRFQLWRFDQVLAPEDRYRGHDRLFVPRIGHVTGELDVHDVHPLLKDERGGADDVLFVNTLYSCLARPSARHSFEPVWRPPFVSKLVPEDRCHLNGLAMEGGRPRYVTAVARSDERQGWRPHRADGGVVLDVATGEVVASGLSMPHSPRLHRGELYVLDSGHGDFGRADLGSGRFEPIAFCPGYLRGLAFRGGMALVGLSKPRDRTFQGLPLDRRLAEEGAEPSCGLRVIDLATGETRHWLEVHGVVLELYDVAVVPEAERPMALGFKSDELRRTITFEAEGRAVRHELRRLEEGAARPESSPLPRGARGRTAPDAAPAAAPVSDGGELPPRIAARTLELTLEQALARADLTFPDLRRTADGRPLPEPLLATVLTPAPEGEPAAAPAALAAAVSVIRPGDTGGEVVSFVVRSGLRGRGLGKLLLAAVEAEMARRGLPGVELSFRSDWASAGALRALLAGRGWSEPRTQVLLAGTDARILALPWLEPRPLPEAYEVFPWHELTPGERRDIVRRQQRGPWFPEALSPFQLEERIDPEVSVGLRHRPGEVAGAAGESRVIGWLLAHRAKEDVVQYTSLFVEEGHGKLGRGLPLIAAAARRQEATGVPRAIFMVQARNRAMRRLVERRLAPYLTERAELLRSGKRLSSS